MPLFRILQLVNTLVMKRTTKSKSIDNNLQNNQNIDNYPTKTCQNSTNIGDDCDVIDNLIGAIFRDIIIDREIVIVCFGTMAIVGDSIGPRVGTLLKSMSIPAFVYGDEDHTINGKNMSVWIDFITRVHAGALILAIDASLGARDKIGEVVIRPDGVCPAAVNGSKQRFGDIGILAIVGENTPQPVMQLMTQTPLYIEQLAQKTAYCVKNTLFA